MDQHRNTGTSYLEVLARTHRFIHPQAYLEIGVAAGATLKLSACPTIAVDTNFANLQPPFVGEKAVCFLFQMTSDQFFRDYVPHIILANPIDLAFLDGFHLIEWLLRDFACTEASCHRGSVIALHDCVPPDRHFIRRDVSDYSQRENSGYPDGWGGDVWKIVPLLRKYRPDLRVHCFNSDPTGLVYVTNLDPSSTLLTDRYFEIIEEAAHMTLPGGTIASLIDSLCVMDTKEIGNNADMARFIRPRS